MSSRLPTAVFAFVACLPLLLFQSVSAEDLFKSAEDLPKTDREAEIAALFADAVVAEPKGPGFDRTRGQLDFFTKEATYIKGDHSGRWNWPEWKPRRWGMYDVEVTYVSVVPKMGVQFFVGDAKAKGYVPNSGGMTAQHSTNISRIYIPDTTTSMVGVLTGEDSNGPTFKLRHIRLTPGPEGTRINQSIDGQIELKASLATTFSENMRYEPKPEKNCLGFWTEIDDWAEWKFSVHNGGKFQVDVYYGCGNGNEGSVMGIWFNELEMPFEVEDTGGFQSWKKVTLGEVEAGEGRHLLTAKPKTKAHKAVADIHKIVLTPVE